MAVSRLGREFVGLMGNIKIRDCTNQCFERCPLEWVRMISLSSRRARARVPRMCTYSYAINCNSPKQNHLLVFRNNNVHVVIMIRAGHVSPILPCSMHLPQSYVEPRGGKRPIYPQAKPYPTGKGFNAGTATPAEPREKGTCRGSLFILPQ